MKDPHNYAKVGYSMILVAGSLAAIGIIALFTVQLILTSVKKMISKQMVVRNIGTESITRHQEFM
jgi:hypothetical protein